MHIDPVFAVLLSVAFAFAVCSLASFCGLKSLLVIEIELFFYFGDHLIPILKEIFIK